MPMNTNTFIFLSLSGVCHIKTSLMYKNVISGNCDAAVFFSLCEEASLLACDKEFDKHNASGDYFCFHTSSVSEGDFKNIY